MSDDDPTYVQTVAPSPFYHPEVPRTAETLMRYAVADGLVRFAQSLPLVRDATTAGLMRWSANAATMIGEHDRYLLLAALRDLDPVKADELAERMIVASEAGDSYGEWFWQWADEMGMDPERIDAEVQALPPWPADGAQRIARERVRQVEREGWSADHDDAHGRGELLDAAMCYLVAAQAADFGPTCVTYDGGYRPGEGTPRDWPWHPDWWKPSEDPARNLEKAGALIAAEIDRRQRAADEEAPGV